MDIFNIPVVFVLQRKYSAVISTYLLYECISQVVIIKSIVHNLVVELAECEKQTY